MNGPINIGRVKGFHEKFIRFLGSAVDLAALETAEFGLRQGYNHAPFKKQRADGLTSKTKGTVIRTRRGSRIVFSNAAKYARAQDLGSGTHAGRGKYRIAAVKAKALRFQSGGKWIFRRAVMHPGVPATRFLRDMTLTAGAFEGRALRMRLDRWAIKFSQTKV